MKGIFLALITIIGAMPLDCSSEMTIANFMECEERHLQFWQPLPDDADLRCRCVLPTMLDRSYIFCLSSKLRTAHTEPIPLVLAFHGGHGRASAFQAHTHWEESGLKYNFAVAYLNGCKVDMHKPEISCHGGNWNTSGSKRWGSCELCGIDDTSFVDQVIADIQTKYLIEPDKIFAVGHSKGGMFAYSLACDRPHILAGIGVTAATLTRPILGGCQPNDQVAIFHVHNLQDLVVPFEGNEIYPAVSPGLEHWAVTNGCALLDKNYDLKEGQCAEIAYCPESIRVELCLLNEIGGDPALDPEITHRYRTYDAAFSAGNANKEQSIREAFVERFLK
jgi:poly(3-hydroxybutyrate) depolymerase